MSRAERRQSPRLDSSRSFQSRALLSLACRFPELRPATGPKSGPGFPRTRYARLEESDEQPTDPMLHHRSGAGGPSLVSVAGGAAAFLPLTEDGTVTDLNGTLPDQSALQGVLNRIWNLNLTVLSVSTSAGEDGRGGPGR